MRPGEVRAGLPASPPAHGEPLPSILADVERLIAPGLTHWNHPGFFAYFANSSTTPAILGEMLSAAFNVNGMLWKTAPAATELEVVVLDWLRQMTGLPEGLFGVIQDTASSSVLVALAAAREAVPGLDARRRGLVGQARLRMYASDQAHSSVEKAGIVLGIGQDGLRKIPVDDSYRMDPAALARAVAEDRSAGWTPFAVDGHGGHHLDHQHRSRPGHRRRLRPGEALAARRRGLRRLGRGRSRDALAPPRAASGPTRWS